MTISAQTAADNRTSATGNGVTTSFTFGKPFTAQADLVVNLVLVASPYTATLQVLNTDYTVSGTADAQGRYGSGANVVFSSAPSSLYNVVIYADPSVAQGLDLVENDPLPAEQVELALDKCALQDRRARDILSRVFRLTDSSVSTGALTVEPIASQYLGFDASKNLITIAGQSTAPVSTFMATVLLAVTAAAARITLGFSAIAAKGDTFVGTAANTIATKTAPANGFVRVADSGAADGWTDQVGAMAWGHCQLTKSGANLLLSRFSGRGLFINGKWEDVPVAGVTLAPPAVASTTYNIYAYMNSGTMTLEQSATAHAADATYGHQIKTGDATRTLVGMARTTAGNAWQDDTTACLVISYFNRRDKSIVNNFTTTRTTTSAVYVELNSEIRCNFLTWADEAVFASFSAFPADDTPGSNAHAAVGFDGTNQELIQARNVTYTANGQLLLADAGHKSGLAEGFHYATLLGAEANTHALGFAGGTFASNTTPGSFSHLSIKVHG